MKQGTAGVGYIKSIVSAVYIVFGNSCRYLGKLTEQSLTFFYTAVTLVTYHFKCLELNLDFIPMVCW